ncbi:MAG: hypothetical protein JXR12_15375 [Neptunomonas phycophila]|uniref:hypothetical protein n=1 Tax=Neptunomonas phycophila TaxID=1572645 RepID=UPI003B8DBBD3
MSPEQIVAQNYADSISRELGYFERTIEFLPPNSEHVKLVGNGWITFVWEQQCFMMSDQYHNVAKSAAMMTTMPMDICMRHKDLRTGPTVIIKHENTNSDSTQVVY